MNTASGWIRSSSRAALALAAGCGAACTTLVPLSPDYRGPHPLPEEAWAAEFDSSRSEPVLLSGDVALRERARFSVRQLAVPSATDPSAAIEFEYYDVEGDLPTPVVVLLPIFNGQTTITRYFARYFANQGWAAIVVARGRDPLRNWDAPEEAVQRNLSDYRRVLDWAEQQQEIDPQRIGLFGVSLGAMDAVMLTALDDRVRALVVAMAGGDWPYLLMNTHYRPVVRTLDDKVAAEGRSREQVSAEFDARIDTDPLVLAPYVDAERVLMIITRTDAIIPFASQQQLRERMGSPETLYLITGHRPSVLLFPKVRATAFAFLTEQFAVERVAFVRD